MHSEILYKLINLQKQGIAAGIYSVCSSNPFVLNTVLKKAKCDGDHILIESTSNQVNQYGGYMNMNPSQFSKYVSSLVIEHGINPEQVLLGGDHLGPYVWRNESEEIAMEKAARLVTDYIEAGYSKIHLDASMPLGRDPNLALPYEVISERTAFLCQQAEYAWRNSSGNPFPP